VQLTEGQLVNLGEDDVVRQSVSVEKLHQFGVLGGYASPWVHQNRYAAQSLSCAEKGGNKLVPFLGLISGSFGISIARQIHHPHAIGAFEEIDGLSASRSVGGTGEARLLKQSVEQAGLAHVRPADERELHDR
jgi:hypothetical protein